jgi:hypothetical protein
MKLRCKQRAEIPLLDPDVYPAICVGVIDIGTQYYENESQEKMILLFELPTESTEIDGEIKARTVPGWYTQSLDNRSNLYKAMCVLVGEKTIEPHQDNPDSFDPTIAIGKSCQARISVNKNGKGNYVKEVFPIARGMVIPDHKSPYIEYSVVDDGFSGDRWDSLPAWIKEHCKKSTQYQENLPEEKMDIPKDEPQEGDVCPI